MVFKSFFVKGETDRDGSIALNVEQRDCNVKVGQFRLCISNLVLKLSSEVDGAISVSTNLGIQHFPTTQVRANESDPDRPISVFQSDFFPVRLSVLAIKGAAGETVQAIREGSCWLHFERPPALIKFYFLQESKDKETPLKALVFATVLLERTS